jgi:WD repeat-containing protein 89
MYDSGVWVLDICTGVSWSACSLSTGTLNVYDNERLCELQSYSLPTRDTIITDLSSDYGNGLISSSKSGILTIFDIRQSNSVLSFGLPQNEEALTVDLGYNGALAAVGSSKSHIHFFDIRAGGKLLGSYVDAHTDDVTMLRFQPSTYPNSTSSLLISASEDGLACIFDTCQPSEEAALQGVLNVQAPLRKVGFFGPAMEGVYCLTGSETLSVWHHETAQRICDFGSNLRSDLSQVSSVQVDYLVDCSWDANQQQLSLLAGNNSGDGETFLVEAGSISPSHTLQNGHKGVIRSWTQIPESNHFLTVGEDARLCEWNRQGKNTPISSSLSSKAPSRRPKSKGKESNPY